MKYYRIFIFLFSLVISIYSNAQRNYLSIGTKNAGICFGNSKNYNGVRLNLFDKTVEHLNGLNISLSAKSKNSNGLSLSLSSHDSICHGVSVSLVKSAYIHKGVAVAVFGVEAQSKISGIALSGLGLAADTLNGFFVSTVGSTRLKGKKIAQVRGVSIGFIFGANCEEMNGISIGIINKAKRLHGIQFGLWNIAENNKRLKRTPFINFNFRKNKSD